MTLSIGVRNGLEILAGLRGRGLLIPVLVMTARDAVEDRVLGLDSGADDYLVKPFAFAELVARLRVLIRRGRPEEALRVRLADLELDPVRRSVRRGDQPIDLTAREFELLDYLLHHQGQIVSRDMLARDVWKERSRACWRRRTISRGSSTPCSRCRDGKVAGCGRRRPRWTWRRW